MFRFLTPKKTSPSEPTEAYSSRRESFNSCLLERT